VRPKPLSSQQREWLDHAYSEIDDKELTALLVSMVNIFSPPGREKNLAQHMVSWMKAIGLDTFFQQIDEEQGNAIGLLSGNGSGPELLLWGELDMCFGIADEERLGMGSLSRAELRPEAQIENGYVIGLGAENPKGFAACAAMAVRAIQKANIP